METFFLDNDLKVFYVVAQSFPEGIQEAFNILENKVGGAEGRIFFGISHQTAIGKIIYKAAMLEKYEGEGKDLGFETLTIPKGEYLTETIMEWRKHLHTIGESFMRLLETPLLDTSFACVEWYKCDEEVLCMVRIYKEKATA